MTLQEIKEQVNLIKYARDYHGLECNRDGKAHCPFHKPDKNPSFVINFDGGIWKWFDHHDQQGGSIVDFEMRFANCSKEEAIKTLLSRHGDQLVESEKSAAMITETVSYIYKDVNGKEVLKKEKKIFSDGKKTYTWRHKENNNWLIGKGNQKLIPYNLDKFKNHKKAVICEGEKDCDNVNSLGVFSTTAPAGAQSWQESLSQYFSGFDKIVFMYDVGAENWAKKHASSLKRTYLDKKILIASIPMETKDSDITDYMNQFKTKDEAKEALLELLQTAEELTEPVEEEKEEKTSKIVLLSLNEIKPEPVEWLWYNRIPLGKYSLIVGDPGSGKSTLAFYMTSLITTGRGWPDIGGPIIKGSVIYFTSEDGYADTIRTRIDAMGGDVEKVKILDSVQLLGINTEFIMPDHVSLLEEIIERISDLRLLVLDSITATIGMRNANSVTAVRSALVPMKRLTEKKKFSLLGISHMNKDEAMKALYRPLGSGGWVGQSRATFIVVKDEDLESRRRTFAPLKTNLSYPHPKGLAFNINPSRYKAEGDILIDSPVIDFLPGYIDETADELIGDKETRDGALAKTEAKEFLQDLLKSGPMKTAEVYKLGEENKIASEKTIQRARKELNIKATMKGNVRYWKLPKKKA